MDRRGIVVYLDGRPGGKGLQDSFNNKRIGGDNWIGRSLERGDAADKLAGRERFLPDLDFPGLLHAQMVPSPLPHANIRHISCEAAREAPGVRALITAESIPGENQVGVIIDDQPLIATGKVRHVGETLAILAAESPEEARAAAALVHADLEPLPALLSLDELQAQPEHPIHEDGPIATHHKVRKGIVEQGFVDSDAVVQGEFRCGGQEHYYLEPLGAVALPERGGLLIYGGIQCPFYVQKAVARCCGLPLSAVRVIQTPTGGAFGGKEDVPSEICAKAALLAQATGRPVRLLLDRPDDLAYSSKRHPFRIHGRLGAKADGTFTAIEMILDADAGAYATLSPPVLYRAAMQGGGPYVIPKVKIDARGWYSNHPPSGAFRGFGAPQAAFAHERLVEMMAAELKIDPVELRRRNMLREGDETCTGHKLESSVGAIETLERCEAAVAAEFPPRAGEAEVANSAAIGPPTKRDIELAPWLAEDPSRWRVATGYASILYGNCLGKAGWHMDGAGAHLQLHKDGTLSLAVGLTEIGQGAETVLTQFVSEGTGIDPSAIRVLPVDTALVPDSGPTVASRNVVMSGNAILVAAKALRDRIRPLAAKLMGCDENEIEFAGGGARGGTKSIAWPELAAAAFMHNLDLVAQGWWHVPPLDFDLAKGRGEAYFAYSFATQAARVAVDRVGGHARVIKVWAAHDLGRAINPAGIEGQVEGGVMQGIGWALTERLVREKGVLVSDSLASYQIPTSLDAPAYESIVVEAPHPDGPLGAKSLGEPVIIPTAAAVLGAVSHASGVPVSTLPLDPEKLLNTLEAPRNA